MIAAGLKQKKMKITILLMMAEEDEKCS